MISISNPTNWKHHKFSCKNFLLNISVTHTWINLAIFEFAPEYRWSIWSFFFYWNMEILHLIDFYQQCRWCTNILFFRIWGLEQHIFEDKLKQNDITWRRCIQWKYKKKKLRFKLGEDMNFSIGNFSLFFFIKKMRFKLGELLSELACFLFASIIEFYQSL